MRKKEDKCLICLKNNSTQKGSHLMPASLGASCDNGRSTEELYFIGESINVYYGPSNQRNNNHIHDTTRHTNYNVLDYIFCPDCEKKLSVIENAVLPFLTQTVPSNNGYTNQYTTSDGLEVREYSNVDLAEIKLFFYTVVWRLALGQKLNYDAEVFSKKEYGILRKLMNQFLSHDINEIKGNHKILDSLPLTIISSNFQEKTKNQYAPHRIKSEPQLFAVNEYLVFVHFSNYLVLKKAFGLPLKVFDFSIINKNTSPLKIGFIDDDEWLNFLKTELQYRVKTFQEVRIHSLMLKLRKSYEECHILLHKRTHVMQVEQLVEVLGLSFDDCAKLYLDEGENLIQQQHLKGYGFTFDYAYKELMQ